MFGLLFFNLHDQTVGCKIWIHPPDHITLFNIEVMPHLVLLKNHITENAVDLHHSKGAADLHTTAINGESRIGRALAGFHLININLKRFSTVIRRGYPHRVAIQIAHCIHICIISQGVLGDKENIRTHLC